MSHLLAKLFFLWRKPKVVIITGQGRDYAAKAISQVLEQYFKIGKQVLIFQTDLKNQKEFEFFIKKSSLPILVVTHMAHIPSDKDFFAADKEQIKQAQKLAKTLPVQGYLVLSFDDETVRGIEKQSRANCLSFGFQDGADFRATDIKSNPIRNENISNGASTGTNFKIVHKGNIIPVWLKESLGKEQIYSALCAATVGTVMDINLVDISQTLKKIKVDKT